MRGRGGREGGREERENERTSLVKEIEKDAHGGKEGGRDGGRDEEDSKLKRTDLRPERRSANSAKSLVEVESTSSRHCCRSSGDSSCNE